ncbi:hypothetical protein EVB57_015 [Rhizobium phage RHph_Y1_20]|uniref:Uncharacterized protein n=1 Tax=Rhizobium phage RHph_Y1_20 TaxID=2509571 RepID=A0A7S5QYH4_9CAUD|nr:hypothetical protein EVB57_015 [Rhizobium phage RHph_Y1_20]
MSQHCRANPCCGERPCEGVPLPQHASGLVSHNKTEVPKVERLPITAVLHDVCTVQIGGKMRLIGRIEADVTERFPDGTVVHTSDLVGRWKNVARTRNSTYFIASERTG